MVVTCLILMGAAVNHKQAARKDDGNEDVYETEFERMTTTKSFEGPGEPQRRCRAPATQALKSSAIKSSLCSRHLFLDVPCSHLRR